MQKHRRVGLFFMSVILAATSLNAETTFAQQPATRDPQPPAWVNKDGTLNLSNAPREVPAVTSDGKLATEANGNERRVPTYFSQVPPPPLRGGELAERATTADQPPLPTWINKDGTLNLANPPGEVPAVTSDGAIAREANGNERRVPTYFSQVPPPPLRGVELNKP